METDSCRINKLGRHGMERILVVEDDRFFREMYCNLLSGEGFEVQRAASVHDAMECLRETEYHLIVTDLVMPGQSGIDLLFNVKKNYPDIDIIMVTGDTTVESAIQALKNGARDYLLKPVNHDELLHSVALCMDQRRLRNENIELKDLFAVVRTAKNEWESTLDCIPEMVILVDTVSIVKRCNRTFVDYIGKDFPEIIGKNLRSLLREHGLPVDDAGTSVRKICSPVEDRWFEIRKFPYADKENPVTAGQVVIISDITQQKKFTEQLEEKNHELECAYDALTVSQARVVHQEKMATIGQLSAGVAHEINNPMGFITSNLNTLGKYVGKLTEFVRLQRAALAAGDGKIAAGLRDKERAIKLDFILVDIEKLIKESLDGGDRVRDIVKSLKSFSRADDGERVAADINGCVESAITIAWNEIKYKAALEKELGVLPLALCCPSQLNQVFMNLLINAVQAIDKEGRIIVRTWYESPWVCASVSDTGCGIPPETLSRIFEPFFTTKEVGSGTGLGLSISYELIQRHGGDILVDSVPGKGSTFTVRLPVTEEQTASVKRNGE
jgi:two-component system, NtrC family, sensor kinase